MGSCFSCGVSTAGVCSELEINRSHRGRLVSFLSFIALSPNLTQSPLGQPAAMAPQKSFGIPEHLLSLGTLLSREAKPCPFFHPLLKFIRANFGDEGLRPLIFHV